MHKQPHPLSGRPFRVNIGADLHAIYDTELQGKIVRLEDWADRMDQGDLSTKDIEVLLSLYAHRCLPDLEPSERIPLSAVNLDGLVYGTVLDTIGREFVERVVLRETELAET